MIQSLVGQLQVFVAARLTYLTGRSENLPNTQSPDDIGTSWSCRRYLCLLKAHVAIGRDEQLGVDVCKLEGERGGSKAEDVIGEETAQLHCLSPQAPRNM
jgi:hypothetical protein